MKIALDDVYIDTRYIGRAPLIYVSGPLTTGHMPTNIMRAIDAAYNLMVCGYSVIVPHEKAYLMEMLHPMRYAYWLAYDLRCVLSCDAVYRVRGESRGADIEVRFAKSQRIPVFNNVADLMEKIPPDKYRRRVKRPL